MAFRYRLNRSKPFDTVHGENPESAQTMQVQDGKVLYFGPDDYEVGGEAQEEAQAVPVKPEPKRRPKPTPEPVLTATTEAEQGEFFESEGDAQLDLERQLAANLS
jgi:hypothetical protein